MLLGIDTSDKNMNICLYDNKVIADISINTGDHCKNLLPVIENVLNFSNVKLNNVSGFVVSDGPGSFTGLKIAASTIKALSLIEKKPIYKISTLDVLINNVIEYDGIICSIIDARNNNVFSKVVDKNNVILEAGIYLLDDLIEILDKEGREILFVGNAINVYMDKLNKNNKFKFATEKNNLIRASSLCELVNEKDFYTAFDLNINYYRESKAERLKNDCIKS